MRKSRQSIHWLLGIWATSVYGVVPVTLFANEGAQNAPPTSTAPETDEGLWSWIWDGIQSAVKHAELKEAILSIAGVGAVAVAAIIRRKAKKLEGRLRGRFDLPMHCNRYGIDVIFLGIGGSGKTQLVRSLTCSKLADPRAKTDKFSIHSLVLQCDSHATSCIYHLDFWDYMGQFVGTLTSQLAKAGAHPQKTNYSLAIILVVDGIPPPEPANNPELVSSVDVARIQEHAAAWCTNALAAIKGLLNGKTPRLVGVFLNKSDLLRATGDSYKVNRAQLDVLVNTLASRLGQVFAGSAVCKWYGSAMTGHNLLDLLAKLLEEAQPLDGKKNEQATN